MRWQTPRIGATRIRSWFAFLPAWCEATGEYRWWEWVTVEEAYVPTMASGKWTIHRFLDSEAGGRIP